MRPAVVSARWYFPVPRKKYATQRNVALRWKTAFNHTLYHSHQETRKSCTERSPVRSIGLRAELLDAALRRIGKSRHGGHKIANITRIVDGFKNGFHQWIQRIFLVVVEAKIFFPEIFFYFSKFGSTLPPCSG